MKRIVQPEASVNLYKDGFEEQDLLQRERLGDALSDLLNQIDDPLVIALDGNWGTGKTYFLKRWVGEHARRNGGAATTVYFDAFANDSFGDPFPALVSAVEERISQSGSDGSAAESKENIHKMKEAAFRLAKPVARAGLALAGAGIVLQTVDELAKAGREEARDRSEGFWKAEKLRRVAMEEFRNAIGSLAASAGRTGKGSAVVIVVDELDRCRPDYALEVLEVIKHFFSVPRLHFVLGVNLTALKCMVCARYGSEIDAHAYLAKFIQVTLDLPGEFHDDTNRQQQAIMVYLDHLLDDMKIPKDIAEPLRVQVEIVSRANHMSLRDIGNIASAVSLIDDTVLGTVSKGYWDGRCDFDVEGQRITREWIIIMIDLIISRIVRPDIYPKLLDASVAPADLESYLGASDRVIHEEQHGKSTPEFSHSVTWQYHFWIYLISDGKVSDNTFEILDKPPKQLGNNNWTLDWQRRQELALRTLPRKVHEEWINLFRPSGSVSATGEHRKMRGS